MERHGGEKMSNETEKEEGSRKKEKKNKKEVRRKGRETNVFLDLGGSALLDYFLKLSLSPLELDLSHPRPACLLTGESILVLTEVR